MKILYKVLMTVAVLLVLFLLIGMMLPEKLQVERSIVVRADAHKVYPYVSDFRLYNQWSPWATIDPDIEFSYEGPAHGEGAIMHWRSKHMEIGQGSQKIQQVTTGRAVRIVLALGGMGKAYTRFELQPVQNATRVTWAFDMSYGFNVPGRIMGLLMKDEIGQMYEQGLNNLQQLVEGK